MKKLLFILIGILFVLGIGGISIYNHTLNKDYYNEGYVNGNSAGNLYNSGLFCEYDGIIYFAISVK